MLTLSRFRGCSGNRACRTLAFALCLAGTAVAGELRIERTLMPDAAPSSFAVGFSNGVNFCYDVVRGGVSYVWKGDFVDLTSVRPEAGKAIRPVTLLGDIVYAEAEYFPLRTGDPQRGVACVFKGYRLKDDAIEFIYEIDGHQVREEVRSTPDGSGLVRRFQIEGETSPEVSWWYVPGQTSGGEIEAPDNRREGDRLHFGSATEFHLNVRFGRTES